ncbi:putative lipoprotein, partial [Pseudomonas syringae pv. actinidiae str. M302091]
GQSGIDIIGAYQGGGGGCCYIAPLRWLPGMTVRVDWETGVAGSKGFPGFADRAKYDAWLGRMETQKRQHSKVVPVPDYTGQKVCGLTVHFLPCDNVQVTTSCYAFGSP